MWQARELSDLLVKRRWAITALLFTMGSLPLTVAAQAQQPVINPGGVVNNASFIPAGLPNAGIAQGSLFAVLGANLGAPGYRKAESLPIPTQLAGTSVLIVVDRIGVNALMMYTTPTQVGAVLPSNAPLGNGILVVTYNNQNTAPIPIRVVQNAFGIFTRNQAGSGPAIIQNFN